MNRNEFEQKNQREWLDFDVKLDLAERRNNEGEFEKLPRAFRKICYDLSLAQYRMFGHRIGDKLNSLAIRGYRLIHRPKGAFGEGALKFLLRTFPQTVRKQHKLFWVSSLAFWIPFFAMWFSAEREIAWVQALLGPEGMSSLEFMYGKGPETVSESRQEHGSNFRMFAYYIMNNVGIDFRLFAGGILFGIGTLFFLILNGLHIGAAVGYIDYAGDPTKFWQFVAGHSSFELIGMIIVGMAGLKMGFSLLAPGQFSRGQALAKAGRDGLPLLIGGSLMTVFAAVVEGFWSAQPVEPNIKYSVGITFWVLHLLYFVFVGRRYRGA